MSDINCFPERCSGPVGAVRSGHRGGGGMAQQLRMRSVFVWFAIPGQGPGVSVPLVFLSQWRRPADLELGYWPRGLLSRLIFGFSNAVFDKSDVTIPFFATSRLCLASLVVPVTNFTARYAQDTNTVTCENQCSTPQHKASHFRT